MTSIEMLAVSPYTDRILAAVQRKDCADPLYQILQDYARAVAEHNVAARDAQIAQLEKANEQLHAHGERMHEQLQKMRAAPQPPAEAQRCTCPSGDGSLRWPCPAHPPEAQPAAVQKGYKNGLNAALGIIANLGIADSEAQTNGREDAYRAVEALAAQQPAACTHSWHDYGTVNRAWCSRCNAVAVIGHEDRPYGALTVTDDGEYRTNPTQQPPAEAVGTVLGGEFHYLRVNHGLPDGTKLYTPPPSAPVGVLTPDEREVVETLLELAYASWNLADNSEDAGGEGLTVERSDFAALEKHLNTLSDLPDDQPDYTMGEAAKARWALRRLLSSTTPPSAPVGVAADILRIVDTAIDVCNDRDRPAMAEDLEAVRLYVEQASAPLAQQPAAAGELAELVGLLDEVRSHFTRDDDLPDDLLPRIDAALAAQQVGES